MMKKEPVACMLGSSNRQENGEWRESALHVEQKGEVAGAGGRRGAARRGAESRFFDLQSRPSARSGRCSLLPFRETRLKGTKRRGEKEIDQRHRRGTAAVPSRPVPSPYPPTTTTADRVALPMQLARPLPSHSLSPSVLS